MLADDAVLPPDMTPFIVSFKAKKQASTQTSGCCVFQPQLMAWKSKSSAENLPKLKDLKRTRGLSAWIWIDLKLIWTLIGVDLIWPWQWQADASSSTLSQKWRNSCSQNKQPLYIFPCASQFTHHSLTSKNTLLFVIVTIRGDYELRAAQLYDVLSRRTETCGKTMRPWSTLVAVSLGTTHRSVLWTDDGLKLRPR